MFSSWTRMARERIGWEVRLVESWNRDRSCVGGWGLRVNCWLDVTCCIGTADRSQAARDIVAVSQQTRVVAEVVRCRFAHCCAHARCCHAMCPNVPFPARAIHCLSLPLLPPAASRARKHVMKEIAASYLCVHDCARDCGELSSGVRCGGGGYARCAWRRPVPTSGRRWSSAKGRAASGVEVAKRYCTCSW